MESHALTPSILPYLQFEEGRFSLQFRADERSSTYPFTILTDSSPYSRLLDTAILSDTGSVVCRASTLLQKDRYSFGGHNELWPLNNLDIEKAWNQAFLGGGDLLLTLDKQTRDGRLLPFQSLFFCRQTKQFFQPFCPKCASPLQQCKDDERLAHFHLEPYSTSLKRYLYCASCNGESDFYVFEREDTDPPELNDRRALIKDFRHVLEGGRSPKGFPCVKCSQHELCYGEQEAALSRMTPLSFYPFFMLVLKPVSVSSTDFLNLLSGASLDELAARHRRERREGRAACLDSLARQSTQTKFVFESGEKHFLEVLYLKLAFLAEISEMIFAGSWQSAYPDPGFTTERLWISLPEQSGYLPYFWNFKTRLIDPVAALIHTGSFPAATPPSREGLHFLGRLWFFSMITNSRQDVPRVNACVSKEVEKRISKGTCSESLSGNVREDSLCPQNIFWEPRDPKLTDRSRWMWNRAVELGMSLLTAAMDVEKSWSSEQFRQDFHLLRDAVKGALFHERFAVHTVHPEEEKAISGIIEKMMNRRSEKMNQKDATGVSKSGHPGNRSMEESESEEEWEARSTIVLSTEDLLKVSCSKGEEEEENPPRTLTRDIFVSPEADPAQQPNHAPDPIVSGVSVTRKSADGDDEDEMLEETLPYKGNHT